MLYKSTQTNAIFGLAKANKLDVAVASLKPFSRRSGIAVEYDRLSIRDERI